MPVSGTAPAETVNSWNWPCPISLPGWAVHVMVAGALVIVVPSTTAGDGRVISVMLAVHPGTALTETEIRGVVVGRVIVSLVVVALSDSLGTRNVNVVVVPVVVDAGVTGTCADAEATGATTSVRAAAAVARPRPIRCV